MLNRFNETGPELMAMKTTPEVLLVDDNPADIDLTSVALGRTKRQLHISSVEDGSEAILFLRHEGKYGESPQPDLVVLDLSLPRKTGREVLANVKADPVLSAIPVVVFSTSQANSDISSSYALGANCYLRKPGNLNEFMAVVQSMADFWLGVASLPQREK
jgi:chemotaxis family two-component system response regulator Rcp1